MDIRVGDVFRWRGGGEGTYTVLSGRDRLLVLRHSDGHEVPAYSIINLRSSLARNNTDRIEVGEGAVVATIDYEVPSLINETTHTVHCAACSAAWPEFAGEERRTTCMACGNAL